MKGCIWRTIIKYGNNRKVIKNRKSKEKQYNGQKKKDKRIDLQSSKQKSKDCNKNSTIDGVNSGQGWIQDFKLGGAHLKKMRRAEGGANIVGVFRVKNHDFTPKYHTFLQF